jgi:hypothetical protein
MPHRFDREPAGGVENLRKFHVQEMRQRVGVERRLAGGMLCHGVQRLSILSSAPVHNQILS